MIRFNDTCVVNLQGEISCNLKVAAESCRLHSPKGFNSQGGIPGNYLSLHLDLSGMNGNDVQRPHSAGFSVLSIVSLTNNCSQSVTLRVPLTSDGSAVREIGISCFCVLPNCGGF